MSILRILRLLKSQNQLKITKANCSSNLTFNSINELASKYNFLVKKIEYFPELKISVFDFNHKKSGAKYIHLGTEDKNNTFCVTFRTPALNDGGLPHILEHLVLSGSKKFPSKDPFFQMYSRSVATFMNAMTFPEHTSYPFSTTNLVDFKNLSDVYLDSVFNPILRQSDFMREGWRLEYEDIKNKSSDIIFKGVVFNEMKGDLSSNDSIMFKSFLKSMFPVSYPYYSGGDPLYIPHLTYNSLKEYHKKFYHPSNSCFVTYGSFSMENHLEYFDKFLETYCFSDINGGLNKETKWKEHKRHVDYYPYENLLPKDKQVTCTLGFKIKRCDTYYSLVMTIISKLLMDGPNSPFYESLIEPNIGLDFSPVSGFSGELKYPIFGIGLKGIHDMDVEKVEKIIFDTFENVVKKGFPRERINEVVHEIELSLKHTTVKRGLKLSLGVSTAWSLEHEPTEGLRVHNYLERFKNEYENNPSFFQEIIEDEFLKNPHTLIHIMKPDDTYRENVEKQHQILLNDFVSKLNEKEKDEIFSRGQKTESQEISVDNMPMIKLNDMDKEQWKYEINQLCVKTTPVQFCIVPTNGITYFKCLIDVSGLPYMLKSYLPLFCHTISQIGAGNYSYKKFSSQKTNVLQGFSANINVSVDNSNFDKYTENILLTSFCLDKNVGEMFKIWIDIFNMPNFDEEDVIRTSLNEQYDHVTSNLSHIGNQLAMTFAASTLIKIGQINEKYSGLSQISFIKHLVSTDIKELSEKFKEIASYIFNENIKISINTSQENVENITKEVSLFIESIESDSSEPVSQIEFIPKPTKKIIKMPFEINFVSKVFPGVPTNHVDYPNLMLLSSVLFSKYLHPEIREKGGAYGSGLIVSNHLLSFHSYRDPNILKTIDVFDKSLDWVMSDEFTENDLEQAKVKTLGKLDYPLAPQDYGNELFISGLTHEMKQTLRDRIFSASIEGIRKSATKYLKSETNSVVVLAKSTDGFENSDWQIEDLTSK